MHVLNVRLLRHSKASMKKTKVSYPLDFGKAPGLIVSIPVRKAAPLTFMPLTFMQAQSAASHTPSRKPAMRSRSDRAPRRRQLKPPIAKAAHLRRRRARARLSFHLKNESRFGHLRIYGLLHTVYDSRGVYGFTLRYGVL
jgi:hypothetical protein